MYSSFRRIITLLVIAIVAFPAFARGANEAEPAPESAEVEQPAAAVEEMTAETADESTESPDEDPTLMDAETTELLFRLGALPFQNRVPSENFSLASLGGEQLALEDFRGKVVFLNFWATWCGPCRDEMPSMQILYDTLVDEGLEIIAVNVLEPLDLVSGFVDEFGFTYPVVLDRDGRTSLRYSVRAYPTTYILDREGNVIGLRQGTLDWATPEIIAGFRELLAL